MSLDDREGPPPDPPSGSPLLWAMLAVILVIGFVLLLRWLHPPALSVGAMGERAAAVQSA